MQDKYRLRGEIELVSALKILAQAYEEISVIKMQKARSKVIASREFLAKLSEVFFLVKRSYQKEIQKLIAHHKNMSKAHLGSQSVLVKNGKTASVLISSNAKFYGDITRRVFHMFTFRLFVENIKKSDSDIVIVGKLGRELFDQSYIQKKYAYFDIPDTNPTITDIAALVSFLIPYEHVEVYYGKFANIVSQVPALAKLSGEEPMGTEGGKQTDELEFSFEPTLEQVLEFFETQGFASLFTQSLHESELARYASRITAMEEAISHIETREKVLAKSVLRLRRLTENKKQQEAVSGVYFFRTQR